jgi:SAM-dependent methyltransferase
MTAEPDVPAVCRLCREKDTVAPAYHKNGYSLFRCSACETLFVHPQPAPDLLERVYSADYFKRGNKYASENNPASVLAVNRQNDRDKVLLVKKYLSSGRLLDVGCAYGGFLDAARANGFTASGIEISKAAADNVQDSLAIDVQNVNFTEAHLPENHFDLVTFWDVLEHLPDPVAAISRAYRILKHGGVLALSTGDVSSLWARGLGRFWELLTPPQHLFCFSRKSLVSVLQQNGFIIREMNSVGKKMTLEFLLFKARETFGPVVAPLRLAARLLKLDMIHLKVNLGDIVCIIAEKA